MNSIFNSLLQFGLHDSIINDMKMENNTFTFFFEQGIYSLSKDGIEKDLTSACTIKLELKKGITNVSDCVEIIETRKGKCKEIDILDFLTRVRNDNFDIDACFFSNFNNTLLLKGYVGVANFEFIVSNIERINLNFDT